MRVSLDLYIRLARKRFPFGRRDMHISRDIHGMRGFETTCGLVLADFHVAACARAEEDWMADGGYKPVGEQIRYETWLGNVRVAILSVFLQEPGQSCY